MNRLRVAAAQYDLSFFNDWRDVEAKARRWVAEAAEQGANLLVFPEYGSLEITSLFGASVYGDLVRQLEALQETLDDFLTLHAGLAHQHGVHIVAPSYPVRVGDVYRNRAYLFSPGGDRGHQDKLLMTRFEHEQWDISAGDTLNVFATSLGGLAVNVCYDSEFPLLARRQVEAGADILLVPSCTDTLAGYYRVRTGCRARALENQCFAVHAPTVGNAAWCPSADANVGAGAVYCPPDRGLPDDGVLAQGALNEVRWVYADLDFAAMRAVREDGQVFNHRDWATQVNAIRPRVRVETL